MGRPSDPRTSMDQIMWVRGDLVVLANTEKELNVRKYLT